MISRNGENYLKQQPNSQAHYVNCKNKLATPHGKVIRTPLLRLLLFKSRHRFYSVLLPCLHVRLPWLSHC
uniref:Uncharacterized protein n=1 Tax=Cannabis sativa TaxID=3483 RepID=A0A803R2T8_CANSA